MFTDCRLGLKDPDLRRVRAHVRLTPDDVDACISRVPYDWHLGVQWNDDDLGNRKLNNCGPAAVVNWSNLMAKVAGLNEPEWGFDEAKRIYTRMGYRGTEATDDGVVLLDLMYQWMLEPFCGRKIDGFYVIGHGEDSHMATANCIAPTIVAASLTRACKTTDIWDAKAADDRNRLWGNHAFLYFADSVGGGQGKSWGKVVGNTDEFRRSRWLECYLPICQELQPYLDLAKVIKIARHL